jgi:ERCC4-type nuclease
VVRELKNNITRGAVVSTATRYEEFLKKNQKQSKFPSTILSIRFSMLSTRTAQKTTEIRITDIPFISERFQGECHYCKKKEHKAINCNKKKAEKKLVSKPEELKNGSIKF